jgi:hypothetical protein
MKAFPLICLLLTVVLPTRAHAYYSSYDSSAKWLYLGVGAISQDAGRLSNTTSASTSLFSTVYPDLALTLEFTLSDSWKLSPLVSYTPLSKSSPEGGESDTLLTFGLRLAYVMDWFDIHFGPGCLIFRQSGSGGTSTQNNGVSTSTFGLPSNSVSATTYLIDAGLGWQLGGFRIDADGLVTDTLTSRRAVNLLATVSYGIF